MLHNKTILVVKPRILYSNKTYFWAPDIPCNHDLFTIFRSSHRRCSIKKRCSWKLRIKNNLRSSRPGVFCKICALRNFAKFTGKPLCLRAATLLKKRLWDSVFPVNFVKFLRTPFFIEQLCWLLLTIKGLKG